MFVYFFIWILICFFSVFFSRKIEVKLIFYFILCFLIFFIGFRYKVGADWYNYQYMFESFQGVGLYEALFITDPGYGYLNYLSYKTNINDIFFVNLLCAFLFIKFLFLYANKFENYWIPLLVAFPYLILVVSMGYTRQSVAIGFILISIIFYFENKIWKMILFGFLALLFHKSAIIFILFLPIIFLPYFLNNFLIFNLYCFCSLMAICLMIYIKSILGGSIYIDESSGISSSGAIFRATVHFFPLVMYFIYRRNFKIKFKEKIRLFDYFSVLIIFFFFLSFYYSTLADRFNLYLIGFDILIFSYLYEIMNKYNRQIAVILLVFSNTLLLLIWFNFGVWSKAWIPYENYISNYIGALFR